MHMLSGTDKTGSSCFNVSVAKTPRPILSDIPTVTPVAFPPISLNHVKKAFVDSSCEYSLLSFAAKVVEDKTVNKSTIIVK